MRAKYESASKQLGYKVPQLENLIALPESMVYIWKYFIDLHNRRSSNGFGINPILYSDIYSYGYLYGINFQEYELDLIQKLDSIALENYKLQTEKANQASKNKR